jgi:hypothetical protein
VVIKGRLIRLGQFLAMQLDVGRGPDLLLRHGDLQVFGTDLNAGQRHEGQVAADEALLDGSELRLVGLDVNVDLLKLTDLLAVAVNEHPAVPFSDVPCRLALVFGHTGTFLSL